jgi:hypothetical protein
MLDEIKDIIAKNLPAQVGETLQKELARIPELEEQLANAEAARVVGIKRIGELDTELIALKAKEKWDGDLTYREVEVEKRERELEVTLLKVKVQEAEKRATELHGIVQTVFKSPVYRKAIFNTPHGTTMHPTGEESHID